MRRPRAEITSIFTEVVIAPEASEEAKAIFAARKTCACSPPAALPDPRRQELSFRSLSGGFLVQSRDGAMVDDLDSRS